MLVKHILPVMAIVLVACMIVPQYASAAEYVDRTINLAIESKYRAEHDQVVNVADESSIQNPDTWDPAPQGIWIGASTQESLFQFDVVATAYNLMKVASVVKFDRTQIMNGVSEFIVRSPIASDDLVRLQLRILKFVDEPMYSIATNTWIPMYDLADATEMAVIDVDLTDVSITSGSDAWTVNGRTYVLVRCPIYSEVNYAFIWNARLAQDAAFKVYMTGQDVANDNITETRIYYATRPMADLTLEYNTTLAIDPGISFDMLSGLGNGVFASSFYMRSGDSLTFLVETNSPFSGYQTIMVPFGVADGTLAANVTVVRDSITSPDYLWSANDTWTHYILACSAADMSGTVAPSVQVTITVWENVRVNWIFSDSPAPSIISHYYNEAALNLSGVEHIVHSRLWYSYQESAAQIFPPSLDPADFPPYMLPQQSQKATWYGTIIGAILVVVGGTMIATGFLAPVGVIVAGVGTAMIIADVAKEGKLIGSGTLPGWMENALDKVRDALSEVGKFVLSIGEGLWDAITWLVDAVVEYGGVLLGLLIIGVSLALFFVPIYAQLKLWGIIWSMAQGKLEKAAAQAQDLASAASGTAGQIKGMI